MARLGILTIFITLLLVTPAFAHDGGEGWYGETTDKVVTNAGFLIIGGLPLLLFILSLIQWREKRKEDRMAAAKARRGSTHWRGGW